MRHVLVVALALCMAGCPEHGSGGGMPTTCEGAVCGADEFCDFGRNGCGNLSADAGVCRPRPTACDDNLAPVCGCDGRVYPNECGASAMGVDVDAGGGCAPPPSQFACGFAICNLDVEYCQHGFSDIGGEPDSFVCRPIPMCPGARDCSCLASEPCGQFCMGMASTGFELQCPGG